MLDILIEKLQNRREILVLEEMTTKLGLINNKMLTMQ
jgi:hypothetical protein